MLNELYDLLQACERSGVELPIRIPGFDTGKGVDGIRLFIDQDGVATRVEPVPATEMKRIRKWECGSGITLPVFNFEPLHELQEEEFAKFRKAFGKLARGQSVDLQPFLEGPYPIRWQKSKVGQLDNAFKKVSADLLGKIGQDETEDGDGWRKLLRILPKLDAKEWLDRLSDPTRKFAGQHCFSALADLLFHNSMKDKAKTVPVQLEVEGANAPIYSSRAQNWLIGVLARSAVPTPEEESETGETASLNNDTHQGGAVWGISSGSNSKYSQIEIPVLGKVRLFDRNVSEKPTSERYAKEGAIFKTGPDVRMKIMAAVEWLAAKDRKGKTWVARSKFGRTDKITRKPPPFLLLTYLAESVGDTPEHLAEVFVGPPEEESDRAIVQFETLCEDVIIAFDGIPALSDTACIRVFALHKPDGYRAQIFASDSFTQSALKQLAESWQADCRAHPPIKLVQFKQGDEAKPQDLEPLVPFPYQAIECLNTIWERCGKAEDAVFDCASDYSLADVFELLRRTGTDPNDAAYFGRMLDLAVRRALPLMGAVGQAMHQVRQRVFTAQGGNGSALKSHLQARRWPCLLSLLLIRIGYKVRTFMKEPAYLIGRFFAQLDRLHSYYAKHVSGKEDGLRQLLGNSLMPVALESPLRAFDLAGQRMLPYQAWGRSFSEGRKAKGAVDVASDEARATNGDRWEVHRVLEELGRIAEDLAGCGIPEANHTSLPTRAGNYAEPPTKPALDLTDTLEAKDRAWMHSNSAAKAQMLLGYLACPEGTRGTATPKTEPAPTPPDFE